MNKTKKITCIIQVRMNSTRLQGKVLLKLDEFSVLDYVISQVRASKNIGKIIIATTQENSDNVIVEYAKKKWLTIFQRR